MKQQRRRTKILATLGPSSASPRMTRKLIAEGVDAFRLNLAHGSHAEHEQWVRSVRKNPALKHVGIVVDIRGSKVRVGTLPESGVELASGKKVTIDTRRSTYERDIIPIPVSLKNTRIQKGCTVFLDDGLITFEVLKIEGFKIRCRVVRGGLLFSRKGVNIPGAHLHQPGVSARDRGDILFGKKIGADYISLSFLHTAQDIARARVLLRGTHTKLIAKIESQEALDNFDEIVNVADMVMIARGDLGLETPMPELPMRQKEIIAKCKRARVPVIVATEMLASMVDHVLPSRAEVSDVANAVFDSVDAVMLSGETAVGVYPAESVAMMRDIIEASERISPRDTVRDDAMPLQVDVAVAAAASRAAHEVGARYILVGTTSGFSALAVSSHRPSVPIVAITDHHYVARQLSLVWGVRIIILPEKHGVKSSFDSAIEILKRERSLKKGDIVVYISGITLGKAGGTNMMRAIKVE